MEDLMRASAWPPLPLDAWEPTYLTLHRWTQVLGKVCLALAPPQNHWWHVTFVVSSKGLEVPALPHDGRSLSITFDFCAHKLVLHCSDGRTAGFALEPMPVATFYDRVLQELGRLDVRVTLNPVPVEVVDRTPLDQDTAHASYDRAAVERLHAVLVASDRVFRVFRGRFLGKSSAPQFFWGAFDLAVGRFCGTENPEPPADPVMREAYSHEVIAHGFWPGGDWPVGGRVPEAVFYAYVVPAVPELARAVVQPAQARFDPQLGEFLLPCEAVRTSADPDATLLAFMESTYRAAAEARRWDIARLERRAPSAKA
jgi:hypothetical protein